MNIVITGAANGIGKVLAEHYIEGNNVYGVDCDKKGLEILREEYPKIHTVLTDLSDIKNIKKSAEIINIKSEGQIDVLINLASIITRSDLLDISVQEWDNVSNINMRGTFFWTQEILKLMLIRKHGKIISISSVAGVLLHKKSNQLPYILSKAAQVLINRQIALDFAEYGIYANTILLGNTDIGMVKVGRNNEEINKFLENSRGMAPLRKLVSKEGVIEAVNFLIHADDITGTELVLDDGYLATGHIVFR